jgi:drug/metabolite transporter (DMT)-like permease
MPNISISKNPKRNLYIGALAIMLAAFLWSLDGTFIRPQLYTLSASLVVFIEHLLGFLLLSPFLFLGWHRIRHLTTKDWGAVLWVSAFGGLLGTIMITKAFFAAFAAETTFATVIILQKLQPVFALGLAAVILKERLSYKFYIWAVAAVAAAYVLAFGASDLHVIDVVLNNKAALYAFIAAFAFGSSTVFGKRLTNHLDFKSVTVLRFGVTAILAFAVILITDELWKVTTINAVQWQLFFLIIFSSGAVALFIYYFGLKLVPASVATIAELFWPVSAIGLDYFINGNTLTPLQLGASAVLLIAMYFVVRTGQSATRTFRAAVIPGRGVGRTLGFATANLDKVNIDIAHGVYVVRAQVNEREYRGLLHFGYLETFKLGPSLELYLKDFTGDLYGVTVEVTIIKKLRDVQRFKDSVALREQIYRDVAALS